MKPRDVRSVDRLEGAARLGLDRPIGLRGLIPTAAVFGAAVGALAWLLVGAPAGVSSGPFAFAAGLFCRVGYGLERRSIPWSAVTLTAVAPLVGVAAFAPYYALGYGPTAAGVLFLPSVVGVLAVGYPLSMVGRRLARGE